MQVIDFSKELSIQNFINHSILNDEKISNGILRLNRFIGVMHGVKDFKKMDSTANNEISKPGLGTDFLSWNIFKIDCPSLHIDIDTREVDMIPRHYHKNWTYDDLSVSFIESSDLKIRHFFFEWMNIILNAKDYNRQYYNSIMADDFRIYPINFQGQAERYEIFRQVTPFDVNSINFDVSDSGDQVALTIVKFKYIGHEILSLSGN